MTLWIANTQTGELFEGHTENLSAELVAFDNMSREQRARFQRTFMKWVANAIHSEQS